MKRTPLAIALVLALAFPLGGCAVVTVAGTAVSVTAGVVGLAADAAIGTARITGKAVGAAADAVLPGEDE
jgi:predicted small secreted protein